MAKKQSKNYTIKYNFTQGHADFKKIMEANFLKYFQQLCQNNSAMNKENH